MKIRASAFKSIIAWLGLISLVVVCGYIWRGGNLESLLPLAGTAIGFIGGALRPREDKQSDLQPSGEETP